MGYNTTYRMYIDDDENHEKIQAVLDLEDEESEIKFVLDDDGSSLQEGKWYSWESDMRRISTLWPNFTFHLQGTGDQNDDIWAATFRCGKAHIRQAEIKIPEFDESQLK